MQELLLGAAVLRVSQARADHHRAYAGQRHAEEGAELVMVVGEEDADGG